MLIEKGGPLLDQHQLDAVHPGELDQLVDQVLGRKKVRVAERTAPPCNERKWC